MVPDFLRKLASNGWVAVRVDAYETRWAGRDCAGEVVAMAVEGIRVLDAVVFTSTAEVEGLLKGLGEHGLDWWWRHTGRSRRPGRRGGGWGWMWWVRGLVVLKEWLMHLP